jgi:hypothetical protein
MVREKEREKNRQIQKAKEKFTQLIGKPNF